MNMMNSGFLAWVNWGIGALGYGRFGGSDGVSGQHRSLMSSATRRVPRFERWGRLDVTPVTVASAIGSGTITVLIYPPGTARKERFLLGLRGALLGWEGLIFTSMLLVAMWMWSLQGLISVLVGLTVLGALIVGATRKLQHKTHQVRVTVTAGGMRGDLRRFLNITERLDALTEHDDLEPVAYEHEWGLIYDQAAPVKRRA